MNDPIGDFIIRIKNAGDTKKGKVSIPFSKIKKAIADLLSAKGYVGAVAVKGKTSSKYLEISLLYKENGEPFVSDTDRVSKPSKRVYKKAKDIRIFRKGFGISVFSTPKGVMTDSEAKKNNLGGEFLFNIW